jgi:hypothetical protein
MQIIPADSLNIFASWLKVLSPRLNFSYLCSVKKVTSVKKQLSLTITNLKTMKKFILTMVALLSMTMAQAQDNNTKCDGKKCDKCEMKKQDPADRMAKELSLTDAQKTQLAELDKEYDAKLKKILNDEQYKKYKQMRKHHGRPGRRGHGGPRGPRPEMPPTD